MDKEIIERIFARRSFGIKPGLATTRALLAVMGNPEKDIRTVHVAGTNGKGSVCALIASVLGYTGIKAGLYTSPHLVRLNERFSINGKDIGDEELYPLLEEVEQAALQVERNGGGVPTFFECMTALAMEWFKRRGVNLVVAETGMGGRLDSTNVLTPLVCVITRIGLDHTMYLGNTIAAIAGEKAGIIKENVPVVCADMPDAAHAVVERAAAERNAPVVIVRDAVGVRRVSGNVRGQKVAVASTSEDYGSFTMKLAASYQIENIATAVAALETLGSMLGIDLGRKPLVKGLSDVEWPGRFQCIGENPDVLIDGAHNPDGAEALMKALHDAKCGRKIKFVVAQSSDKDSDGFFRTIAPVCGALWTVPMKNPRMAKPEALAEIAQRCGIRRVVACATLSEGLEAAKSEAIEDGAKGLVVVCGSLFLVGEILETLSGAKPGFTTGSY